MNKDFKKWEKPPKIESQKIITTCVTVPVAIANERSKMSDLIKRSDAIKAIDKYCEEDCYYRVDNWCPQCQREEFEEAIKAVPSADRPSEIIYGNEHNCIMTIFGECSYAETGCGDCAVVEKVRKALSADRPQGEWIEMYRNGFGNMICMCSKCNFHASRSRYCPNCGARMKGADDEAN